MKKLTKKQAAIIGAYTGITCGPFSEIHEYAEGKFGRPVFTHEFAIDEFMEKLKAVAKDDFLLICRVEEIYSE